MQGFGENSPGEGLTGSLDWSIRMPPLEAARLARRIRKGDLVQVIAGANRGKQGRVLDVDAKSGKLRVEKVRMQKRHLKPGRKGARTGGILDQEGAIDISNVMLVDSASGKPSRARVRFEGDRRVRVFAKSGESVSEPTR
jgi:large subunit ribosomal protein L24